MTHNLVGAHTTSTFGVCNSNFFVIKGLAAFYNAILCVMWMITPSFSLYFRHNSKLFVVNRMKFPVFYSVLFWKSMKISKKFKWRREPGRNFARLSSINVKYITFEQHGIKLSRFISSALEGRPDKMHLSKMFPRLMNSVMIRRQSPIKSWSHPKTWPWPLSHFLDFQREKKTRT